eukprot:Gb_34868 [translate_table: standard]
MRYYLNNSSWQAIEQSRQQHAADLVEKMRLVRMLNDKNVFQSQVVSRRQGEFERLKREREERLAELRAIRKQEREMRRKVEYYRRQEEARLIKAKEEEEARRREDEERKRKEEAERKAKLDEIAAKQRQREKELEEKDRLRKEALIKEEPRQTKTVEPKAGKFVPRFMRNKVENLGSAEPDTDNWRRSEERLPHADDKRSFFSDDHKQNLGQGHSSSSRGDDRPMQSDREADVHPPSGNRYVPPVSRFDATHGRTADRYEPPVRTYRDRYEPPMSGKRDHYEAPRADRARDAPSSVGRYEPRAKYGGFEGDNSSRPRGGFGTRDERWGVGSDRERPRDEDRSGGGDSWRRQVKGDVSSRHLEEQAA